MTKVGDPESKRRVLALADAIDMARRSACAAQAAAVDEHEKLREAMLKSPHHRLLAVVRELEALR